jgi:hypothetical protein
MDSKKHKALNMVVLYTEGCPSTPKTIDLIEECISELGLHVELKKILINSQEDTDDWKFLGSPTVQINGIDIDPSVRGDTNFGFT